MIGRKVVKTRKDHICWGCCEKLPKGSEITAHTSVFDGKISTTYWCDPCNSFADSLSDWQREDGFAEGEIKEMMG